MISFPDSQGLRRDDRDEGLAIPLVERVGVQLHLAPFVNARPDRGCLRPNIELFFRRKRRRKEGVKPRRKSSEVQGFSLTSARSFSEFPKNVPNLQVYTSSAKKRRRSSENSKEAGNCWVSCQIMSRNWINTGDLSSSSKLLFPYPSLSSNLCPKLTHSFSIKTMNPVAKETENIVSLVHLFLERGEAGRQTFKGSVIWIHEEHGGGGEEGGPIPAVRAMNQNTLSLCD